MRSANQIIFISAAFLLSGCGRLSPPTAINPSLPAADAVNSPTFAAAASENAGAAGQAIQDEERNFFVSEALQVKLYLIGKYDPGICRGKPASIKAAEIADSISGQRALAKFIKQYYALTSDLDIFKKLKQLEQISLQPKSGSNYGFRFIDGQCCQQTDFSGEAEVGNFEITDQIINKQSKIIPC